MLITRKIGKILRGKANRTQVVLACVLGAMAGFTPNLVQAPALGLGLFFLFLVLNANLAVFLAAAAVAKALSLALLPLSVQVGTWLLDGPARGFFGLLVNAPFLAWCGLEYYATTGGLALGLGIGLVGGLVLASILARLRSKLAALEEGSEKFNKYTNRWYVKLLLFVFLGGGKGKQTWAQIVEQERRGRPIRVTGVALVLLLSLGLLAGEHFFGDRLLTEPLRQGLERLNGATVDLESLGLRISAGTLSLSGLALADARRLDRNSLSARVMEARIDTSALLRRNFVVDRIVSREATAWERREEMARRVERARSKPPAPPEAPPEGAKGLEEYLEQAATWKERFSQAQELLQMLAGSGESPEKTEEELDREEELLELRRRRARGLKQRTPAVLVRRITLEGIAAESLGWERLDIEATNLSSHPQRVAEPARLSIRSQDGTFSLVLAIAGSGRGRVDLELLYRGIPVERVAASLKSGGKPLLKGGALDLEATGSLSADPERGWRIDLPLTVTLRNSTLCLPGLPETEVQSLSLPIGVRGALAAPGIIFDQKRLADALVQAGRKELADQVRSRADALLGGKLPGVGDALGGIVEQAGSPEEALEQARRLAEEEARKKLEQERKKALEEARKKAEEEARKAAEALKQLPKIPGLPGRKK